MIEENYTCWHKYQNEGDAINIKASSPLSAAKKAVDTWRHEHHQELGRDKVTVFVRDSSEKFHEIILTGSGGENAPEAFI